jgi:hypothetical protein
MKPGQPTPSQIISSPWLKSAGPWLLFLSLLALPLRAETWPEALATMPLCTNATEITRLNLASLLLPSFQSNQTVKAFVLMPGATDEFYFFRRAHVTLPPGPLSLLDAVKAITNQTHIVVTFRPPLLLLHTDEDPGEPLGVIKHAKMAARLKQRMFIPHAEFNDRDWDYLLPILTESLDADFSPGKKSPDSWHFFRHTFAAWNLDAWEALEAISLAGKTTFSVEKAYVFEKRPHVTFRPDERGIKTATGK